MMRCSSASEQMIDSIYFRNIWGTTSTYRAGICSRTQSSTRKRPACCSRPIRGRRALPLRIWRGCSCSRRPAKYWTRSASRCPRTPPPYRRHVRAAAGEGQGGALPAGGGARSGAQGRHGIAAEILGMTGISVERAADGGVAVARMKQPEYLSSALGLRRAHILLGNPLEKHGYLCWVDRSARRR